MAKQNNQETMETALAEQAEAMAAASAAEVATYQERIEDLETALAWLETEVLAKLATPAATAKPTGRKDEVLALLLTGKHYRISELAKVIGINDRNISSQLTYLRKAGYGIATDSLGRKFIEVKPA